MSRTSFSNPSEFLKNDFDGDGPEHVSRRHLYIAATRLVMRCVVILFAEARDLLT